MILVLIWLIRDTANIYTVLRPTAILTARHPTQQLPVYLMNGKNLNVQQQDTNNFCHITKRVHLAKLGMLSS